MKLYFKLNKEALEQQLAQGNELEVKQVLDVDFRSLSEEERKLLLKNCYFYESEKENCGRLEFKESLKTVVIDNETKKISLSGIISYLNKLQEIKSVALNKNIEAFLLGESSFILGYDIPYRYDEKDLIEKIELVLEKENIKRPFSEIKKHVEELIEERKKEVALQEEKYENEKKERKEKEDAVLLKKEELRQWGIQNGSALLKGRIEGGFNWYELANEEWFNTVIPNGFSPFDEDDFDQCWDYNNPTLEHINALKESKKTIFESIKLKKCRKEDEESGDDIFYCFVVGKIRSFDGEGVIYISKEIDSSFNDSED